MVRKLDPKKIQGLGKWGYTGQIGDLGLLGVHYFEPNVDAIWDSF